MEEDYYKLLNLNYNSSLENINNVCNLKLAEYKFLPFFTENDKKKIKQIKTAQFIFNNPKNKKIYDQHILKKNNLIDQNDYLINRIFDTHNNNNNNLKKNTEISGFSLFHNELLRPKNTGLTGDNDYTSYNLNDNLNDNLTDNFLENNLTDNLTDNIKPYEQNSFT
jgi:DnaJ-class molecular chaperone